ncbi:PEP-CTERM sorting domain-containing protein [Noviherbaspirillum sp. ST9]|uniref:PEP-CTERM sorting domain-containing protein n=1 Tax=Noviherbaspirillum sp. ST9 TaxID=3401606 RepID=UPI003B586C26
MKLLKKVLATVALAAAAATSAQASTINVGGVVWDPDAALDFSGTTATLSQFINPVTGVLSGYGVLTTINGTGSATFCPGCELTVEYGGYTPIGGALIPNPAGFGTQIFYSGGFVKVYVDKTPNANPADPLALTAATATDGDLWLELAGHAINGVTLTGFNFLPSFLLGQGLWDVVGGLAQGNLDTNTMEDGADLSFTNSFTKFFPTGSPLISTGTGNFAGNSIPEPGSLLLLSLGLLAIASARRRKSS